MRTKLVVIAVSVALVGALAGTLSAGAASGPGLSYSGVTMAATGASAGLSATLNGLAGPIAGQAITFALDNQPAAQATTDAFGVAAVSAGIRKAAGAYTLKVSGGGFTVNVPFTVTAPATAITDVTASSKGASEPSITTSPDGNLYTSALAGGTTILRSTDHGATWVKPKSVPFNSSGDTTVGTDSQGNVYLSTLDLAKATGPLQIDEYKSPPGGDGPWVHGAGPVQSSNTTNQPFLVDRQWIDSYIAPGKTTKDARVYMTYHDWAPNQIWLQTSTDGGATWGVPFDVITSPVAEADSFCNTIPGGVKVVQSGPHAGRVYVAWLAGDPVFNVATGCNVTQLQTFHTVWLAYSDNADAAVPTWTDQLIYDGGMGHDAGYIFADLTLDNAGNPYVAFSMNLLDQSEWDVFVEASFDGGTTWNGKSDGTGAPYKVNTDTGTHAFPTITAGAPGQVDVAWLRTAATVPTIATGKGAGSGFDENATWQVFVAQSLDLNLGSPTWTVQAAKTAPMHKGDICNLGIFCGVVPGAPGDRSLADFIDIAVDQAGLFHISYTDNFGHGNQLHVANQTAGASLFTA